MRSVEHSSHYLKYRAGDTCREYVRRRGPVAEGRRPGRSGHLPGQVRAV